MSVQRKFTGNPPSTRTAPLKAVVTTATPLDEETQRLLIAELDRCLGLAAWRFEVNPALLGGIRVRLGGRVYDGSAARWVEQLRQDWIQEGAKSQSSPDDFLRMALERLKNIQSSIIIEEVGTVTAVGDGVIQIGGLPQAMLGELVSFSREGVMGMVMNLEEDHIGCVLLGDERRVQEGDEVRLTGRVVEVPVGRSLIGRVVDALGKPLDGNGPILSDRFRPIANTAPGIADRKPVGVPLQTGIKVVDALIPIGRGQRELIIGDRQTGKTALAIDTILNQKGKKVFCFYVCIGQKASTVAQVVEELREHGAMDYTTVVVASASDPAPMQYIAPYAGCAMAEELMYSGNDVLIVYDDLTKHAVAYREMSLLLRRPPGREAYPGDIFYLHARLLERAACLSDEAGGGTMTALPIIETMAGDISAYIPTNVISITDGQIFLESDLFFAGNRPAVNVGISVSRVGGEAQIKAMKSVAGPLKLVLAQYRELASFVQFGAELDAAARAQLAEGERLTELMKQGLHSPVDVADQVVLMFCAARGLLAGIPVDRIRRFESELIPFMHAEAADLMEEIRAKGTVQDVDGRLKQAVTHFKDIFTSLNPESNQDPEG